MHTDLNMDLLKCKDYPEYRLSLNGHIVPPGKLLYNVREQDIIGIDVASKNTDEIDYNAGYIFERHSVENLLRLTPDTASGNANEWKLILVMKHSDGDQMCLKGALRNVSDGTIAFMTSVNEEKNENYQHGNATIKSHDPDWNICHCSIQAPLVFWDELKNRLLN
jgi:hypothetical protein